MRAVGRFVIPVVTLAACGGGDDGPVTSIDAPAAACTISTADFGDKGALMGGAYFEADATNVAEYTLTVQGALEPLEPLDVLVLEFFTGFAPFGTENAPSAVVPGTYELTGTQLSFATCGVCARIATNATASSRDDDYFVTGGTVTVSAVGDAVGETLTVAVANLQFQHVTIDSMTFETTPVGDGCTTSISNATFTGTVMASSGARKRSLR